MTKIETLAAQMNVSVKDCAAFIECLNVWIAKGMTLEQAIERHMSQMHRLVANCHKLPKVALADSLYDDFCGAM